MSETEQCWCSWDGAGCDGGVGEREGARVAKGLCAVSLSLAVALKHIRCALHCRIGSTSSCRNPPRLGCMRQLQNQQPSIKLPYIKTATGTVTEIVELQIEQ